MFGYRGRETLPRPYRSFLNVELYQSCLPSIEFNLEQDLATKILKKLRSSHLRVAPTDRLGSANIRLRPVRDAGGEIPVTSS